MKLSEENMKEGNQDISALLDTNINLHLQNIIFFLVNFKENISTHGFS